MAPYQIDGEDLSPQPNRHRWSYPSVLGNDASGSPIYAKFSTLVLRCDLTVGFHQWHQWMDGNHHTITVPAPGSHDDWEEYGSVFVQVVEVGEVSGAQKEGGGMDSAEMTLVNIEVT